jgi:hypothetical protein
VTLFQLCYFFLLTYFVLFFLYQHHFFFLLRSFSFSFLIADCTPVFYCNHFLLHSTSLSIEVLFRMIYSISSKLFYYFYCYIMDNSFVKKWCMYFQVWQHVGLTSLIVVISFSVFHFFLYKVSVLFYISFFACVYTFLNAIDFFFVTCEFYCILLIILIHSRL